MSEQNPPGTPAEGPDPFAELLKGLIEEPTAEQPAAAGAGAAEQAAQPVTSSADVPTVAFTPVEEPAAAPAEPTIAFSEPTTAFPEPAATASEPIPAAGTPSSGLEPTVVLPGAIDPTAATTVLAGGAGGGLPPSEPPKGGGFRDWDPRRKALFITLIAIAGVLLIALVILLVVLLGGNKGGDGPTPTTSPTRTSTSTPTPTPTKTPTPTPTVKPAIQSFTANTNQVVCTDQTSNREVKFAWTVVGAPSQIAIASAAQITDAIANPFQNGLPDTATDFGMQFNCANAQWAYTLTIQASDGNKYSQVITITRDYQPPAPPAPTISGWTASTTTIACPADPVDPIPTFTLSWSVANWQSGNYVVFGISNPGEFMQFSNSSGSITSSSDFPDFPCGDGQQTYYLTLFDATGKKIDQQVVTVTEA